MIGSRSSRRLSSCTMANGGVRAVFYKHELIAIHNYNYVFR